MNREKDEFRDYDDILTAAQIARLERKRKRRGKKRARKKGDYQRNQAKKDREPRGYSKKEEYKHRRGNYRDSRRVMNKRRDVRHELRRDIRMFNRNIKEMEHEYADRDGPRENAGSIESRGAETIGRTVRTGFSRTLEGADRVRRARHKNAVIPAKNPRRIRRIKEEKPRVKTLITVTKNRPSERKRRLIAGKIRAASHETHRQRTQGSAKPEKLLRSGLFRIIPREEKRPSSAKNRCAGIKPDQHKKKRGSGSLARICQKPAQRTERFPVRKRREKRVSTRGNPARARKLAENGLCRKKPD